MVHQTVAKRKYLAPIIVIVIIAVCCRCYSRLLNIFYVKEKKRAESIHFILPMFKTMPFTVFVIWYRSKWQTKEGQLWENINNNTMPKCILKQMLQSSE